MATALLTVAPSTIVCRLASGILKAASPTEVRTLLGLVIGTDVQAFTAVLAATTASFLTADDTKLTAIEPLADVTDFANVNAALVTPTANILVNSALGDFDFIVGGDTVANLLMVDAGLDAVGIGVAAVSGSILTLNTLTSPLEFITSVFNAGLTTPPTTTTGYVTVEIGGNICHIPCYTATPS